MKNELSDKFNVLKTNIDINSKISRNLVLNKINTQYPKN